MRVWDKSREMNRYVDLGCFFCILGSTKERYSSNTQPELFIKSADTLF